MKIRGELYLFRLKFHSTFLCVHFFSEDRDMNLLGGLIMIDTTSCELLCLSQHLLIHRKRLYGHGAPWIAWVLPQKDDVPLCSPESSWIRQIPVHDVCNTDSPNSDVSFMTGVASRNWPCSLHGRRARVTSWDLPIISKNTCTYRHRMICANSFFAFSFSICFVTYKFSEASWAFTTRPSFYWNRQIVFFENYRFRL